MRKIAAFVVVSLFFLWTSKSWAGGTNIHINTELGGDIQTVSEGSPYPNDAPENTYGAMFWNGSRWVTNDTAAHLYFTFISTGQRIVNHTVTTVDNSTANLGTSTIYPGYSVTKSLYSYTVPAASGSGTYSYQALQYVLSLPDSTNVILRSRGTGHGTAQPYFDVYIEDLADGVTNTTAMRGDPVWFRYANMTAAQAANQTDENIGKIGYLPTHQPVERAHYWMDINGGGDQGGVTHHMVTSGITPADVNTHNLEMAFITEYHHEVGISVSDIQDFVFQPAIAAVDTDGDGISDAQETTDGSNSLDRGSYLPVLGTNLCSEWNGFLGGMWNIAEHVNMSGNALSVQSTLYDISGNSAGAANFSVSPGAQLDLLVHDMAGWTLNSYGKVCSTVNSANPGDLDGRMVYYKEAAGSTAPDYSFEFAFAMPFLNGIKGQQVVPFNTFQPSLDPADAGKFVANWVQITNLESTAQTGTLVFWSQSGAELGRQSVSLDAQARRDYSGHQFGINLVGIVEWLPDNPNAAFQLRNVRYFYDNGGNADTFMAAFQLEGMVGSGELLAVPLDASIGSAILEVANATDAEITVTVDIYNAAGTLQQEQTHPLPAHGSVHIITDTILNGAQGIATIRGSALESVVATAMQYGRNTSAGINYLYGIAARQALGTTLRSSYNTFLNQGCRLLLVNPGSSAAGAAVGMVRYDGTNVLNGEQLTVPAHGLIDYNLCIKDAADNYGVATVQAQTANTLVASVVRLGSNDTYRFPTPVRQ